MNTPSSYDDIPTPSRCYVDFCLVPVCRPHHLTQLLSLFPFPLLPHCHLLGSAQTNTSQVGTASPSVAQEVAAVQRLLQASGLKCTMHSAGTTVEGSWDEVMRVVGQAHSVVHTMGVVRVQTSMRVGTRYVSPPPLLYVDVVC